MSEKLVIIFFWLAFLMYAGAFVFYLYLFISKRPLMGTLATGLAGAGLALHSASFAARWESVGYMPVQGAFESYFLFAWSVVLIYLSLEWITRLRVLGAWAMPLVGTLLGIAWYKYESPARLSSLVKNSWIIMHVTVVFLAYAGFALAAGGALLYLVQQRQLKRHNVNLFFRRLPSLDALDDLAAKAVTFGQLFMTMTIITGIIKAVKSVPGWYLDGLVISTTASWIIYNYYLAARYVWGWQGRRLAYLAIIGFVLILALTFVVRPYLTQFHKFA